VHDLCGHEKVRMPRVRVRPVIEEILEENQSRISCSAMFRDALTLKIEVMPAVTFILLTAIRVSRRRGAVA